MCLKKFNTSSLIFCGPLILANNFYFDTSSTRPHNYLVVTSKLSPGASEVQPWLRPAFLQHLEGALPQELLRVRARFLVASFYSPAEQRFQMEKADQRVTQTFSSQICELRLGTWLVVAFVAQPGVMQRQPQDSSARVGQARACGPHAAPEENRLLQISLLFPNTHNP